jgi:hypothetical protein
MGRTDRKTEAERKYLIAKYMEEGLDHHGIARKFESMQIEGSTRPQNIKRVMDVLREDKLAADMVVASPKQQSIILADVTSRIYKDIGEIEEKIERLSENLEEHAIRVEKLYALKLDYIKELVEAWAITQSIQGSGQQTVRKTTGDKTQINIDKINTSDVKELADEARKILAPS